MPCLLLVLVLVETTDVLFAVDSIPAVLAITQDPFIVFTSNIFAILGLRSLYFVLADLVRTRKQRLNFRLLDGLCRGRGRSAAVAFDLSPDGFVGIALQRGRDLCPFSFAGQIVD